jgi:hypothetical protein
MKYYLYKVIPPRPMFAADMIETESAIMSKHVAYWTDLLDKDVAVAFGRSPSHRGSTAWQSSNPLTSRRSAGVHHAVGAGPPRP